MSEEKREFFNFFQQPQINLFLGILIWGVSLFFVNLNLFNFIIPIVMSASSAILGVIGLKKGILAIGENAEFRNEKYSIILGNGLLVLLSLLSCYMYYWIEFVYQD